MRIRKKLFCLLLALTMAVTFIPTVASAAETGDASAPAVSDGNKAGKAMHMKKAAKPGVREVKAKYGGNKTNDRKLFGVDDEDFDDDALDGPNEVRSYEAGEPLDGVIPANTTIEYEITGDYTSDDFHVLVLNSNENVSSELDVWVTDESGRIKSMRSVEDVYDSDYDEDYDDDWDYDDWDYDDDSDYDEDYDEDGGEGDTITIENGYWDSGFYSISEGDRIVLSARDAEVDFSMIAQPVVQTIDYSYGDFDYEYIYAEAQLIPLDFYGSSPRNAVLYLENNSDYDFSFYVISDKNELISDTDGYVWGTLEADYNWDLGYNFSKSRDYYLLIFNYPDQEVPEYNYDEDYDYYADEDDYELALCMTPQNLSYYQITGVNNKTYTGKSLGTKYNVEYGEVILGTGNYSPSYKNRVNVGTATLTVKGRAPYTGYKTKTFKINPKGTTLSSVKASKKAFTVKWKRQSAKMSKSRITGYQIQYSLNSQFKKGNKLVTVKGYKQTSKKIKKLKKKKKYYVRVRTYKKVGKTTYYSTWSKKKAVKTK